MSSMCLCYILVFAVLISGCEDSKDQAEKKVVVGLEANPQVLDPRVAQDAYSLRILPLVFEGLFQINQNSEPVPQLVESFQRKDELTFVFRLKKDRRFPDGTELTAKDVVYTLKSQADPKLHSRREIVMDKLEELEATGRYEVRLKLKRPYAPLFSELTMGIVPEDEARRKKEELSRNAAGTGPFRVKRFEPGREAVLVKNPHYHGNKPFF
ncbi:MAG: ABC transporter substrate-binding protein, partial [bacterium]